MISIMTVSIQDQRENQTAQAEYEAKRKQAAEDYINRYNQAADIASKPVIEGYEQDIAKVPQQYAAGFNANAVQERINAKNVAERMANMGMTDSGLNRTQQTALTLQRGNADARLREQQQNAIDELTRALNEYKAQQSANKLQNAGNIYQQADVDTANNLTSLYNSARDTATNLYGTNVSANTAQEQMAQEAAIAQAERELQERLQAQKLQQEAAIAQAERELQQQLQKEQLEHERGQNTLDRAMNKWIATHSGSSSSGESDVVQSYWMNAYKALLSQGASSEEAMAQADSIVDRLFGSGTSSGSSGRRVIFWDGCSPRPSPRKRLMYQIGISLHHTVIRRGLCVPRERRQTKRYWMPYTGKFMRTHYQNQTASGLKAMRQRGLLRQQKKQDLATSIFKITCSKMG